MHPPPHPGPSWCSHPGAGLLSSSVPPEMDTPIYLPGSQFGHPPTLPMRISSPGTQPELPHCVLHPGFIAPGTQGLVSWDLFALLKAYSFLGFSSSASMLPNRGLGDGEMLRSLASSCPSSISKALRNSSQVMGAAIHQH